MERGFAAVAEDIADIRACMATKDDLAAVRGDAAMSELFNRTRGPSLERVATPNPTKASPFDARSGQC